MKKGWRWIVGTVVVLAALAAAAMPIVTGMQTERIYREQVALFDAQLNAAYGLEARSEVLTYDRGLYSTRTEALIRLPDAALSADFRKVMGLPAGPVEFVLEQTLQHGISGVDFEGYLRPRGVTEALITQLGGDTQFIAVAGEINLRTQSVEVATQRLEGLIGPDLNVLMVFEPMRFSGFYQVASEEIATAFDWAGLTLSATMEGQGRLALEGIRLRMNGELVAGTLFDGLWVGESRFQVNQMLIEPPDAPGLALESLVMTGNSELSAEQKLIGSLGIEWDRLALPDVPALRGAMELSASQLDADKLFAFLTSAQALRGGNLGAWMRQAEALTLLLEDGPEIGLPVFRIESEAGQGLSGSAQLVISPALAERMRAGQSGAALLNELDFQAEIGIDEPLVPLMPREQQQWVRQLQGFGVLRSEQGQLRGRVAMTRGALQINGMTWWNANR